MGSYSALAGGVALAVLMLPTVTLTAEGAMRMVPQRTKDAAIGMGCTNAQVVWSVTLPTALQGAGSTFSAPLYEKWIAAFERAHPFVAVR